MVTSPPLTWACLRIADELNASEDCVKRQRSSECAQASPFQPCNLLMSVLMTSGVICNAGESSVGSCGRTGTLSTAWKLPQLGLPLNHPFQHSNSFHPWVRLLASHTHGQFQPPSQVHRRKVYRWFEILYLLTIGERRATRGARTLSPSPSESLCHNNTLQRICLCATPEPLRPPTVPCFSSVRKRCSSCTLCITCAL